MLNIDELKEKIKHDVLSRGGHVSRPKVTSAVPQEAQEPRWSRRLKRVAGMIHCESILHFAAWILRPWRGYHLVVESVRQVEHKILNLETGLKGRMTDESVAVQKELSQLRKELSQLRQNLSLTRQSHILRGYELNTLMNDLRGDSKLSENDKQVLGAHADDRVDSYMLAFADACRGDERDILKGLTVYLDYIRKSEAGSAEAPILDLGCGRGEWLTLLRDYDFVASGVDLTQVMVDHCQAEGLSASRCDALDALQGKEPESLGVVSAFHLIEHLPFPHLFRMFEESFRALRPGGIIIFETPNPENPLVGAHTFYHDPTHRNPLTPTGMEFLARYHGFDPVEILRLHPYPESARLDGNDPLTERINGLLCGHQDFAVIAVKP